MADELQPLAGSSSTPHEPRETGLPLHTPTPPSSRESTSGAGWQCQRIGRYRQLLPTGKRDLSWLTPGPILRSRNDLLARALGDPTDEQRRAWVRGQIEAGVDDDFRISRYADRPQISFMVLGDTGEGDDSQYCVIPPLLSEARDTAFMFILSDVIYPSGDVHDYEDHFYRPYKDYVGPIYAIPGNHDWYDGLNGFMRHFCDVPPDSRMATAAGTRGGTWWQRALRGALWRNPARADEARIAAMRRMRALPDQQAIQPGPYLVIDAGPLTLVGIDTGITGGIDADQGRWLRRVSAASAKPKVLLTGKPLYVDNEYKPGRIEGSDSTVDDIVTAPEHNYIAAIGGDVHNYQRYPVRLADGRTIQYIVNGGGGGGMQGTHQIPVINLPGVTEADFRCYPRRGDSLSAFSQIYERRFRLLPGSLFIPPQQAAALMAERLGITPTRPINRDGMITPEARRAFEKIFPRRTRLPGPLHAYYVQFFDWNDPPMFKSFVRVDATQDEVLIRCLAGTGCFEHEESPPVEDAIHGRRQASGDWQWKALL